MSKYNYMWSLFISNRKGLDTPLLIYLRGELGHGSVMKAYNGTGPFKMTANRTFANNSDSITQRFHMLAIDFPCNIGFSNDTNFDCPPMPKNSNGKTTLKEVALTIAEGLKDFFEVNDMDCYLKNLLSLDIFIWSEGFASPLSIYLRKALEALPKLNIKIKGLIMGDPMIDVLR